MAEGLMAQPVGELLEIPLFRGGKFLLRCGRLAGIGESPAVDRDLFPFGCLIRLTQFGTQGTAHVEISFDGVIDDIVRPMQGVAPFVIKLWIVFAYVRA
jgi:hypothetical protein